MEKGRAAVRCLLALGLGLFPIACGGSSSPSGPTPPANTPFADVIYVSGTGGYWGFRVGAEGVLTAVSSGPLTANWPVFTDDGSKAAFWENGTISVRSSLADGTFAPPSAQFNVSSILRNLPGSAGYLMVWNPSGTVLLLIGGYKSTLPQSDYVGSEVIALRHSGSQLAPVAGSPQPGWLLPRYPTFLSDDSMVIRYWGSRSGLTNLPGETRVYQWSGGVLKAGPPMEERPSLVFGGFGSFLLSDKKTLVVDDTSYAVQGADLRKLSTVAPFPPEITTQGIAPLFGRYCFAEAIDASGAQLLASYEVREDGTFNRLSLQSSASFFFSLALMRQNRVIVLYPNGVSRPFGTALVNANGTLGPMRATSWIRTAANSALTCGSDRSQTYLYCFVRTTGEFTGAKVNDDGTIVPFAPLGTGPPFVAVGTGVIVSRPSP